MVIWTPANFWALVLMVFSVGASAADIRPKISDGGASRVVVIEGVIERGDAEAFLKIVRENQGKISGVYIFSPGGDFDEAMKIGRALRALRLASYAPMKSSSKRPTCDSANGEPSPKDPKNCTCASAGFFIHIGAVYRGGNYLAVHRPYIDKTEFAALSPAVAEKAFTRLQASARQYMAEMGTPANIQDEVLNTASDGIRVLDDETVKTYFEGEQSAYRHERLISECSLLSDAETERSASYFRRWVRANGHSDLSPAETDDSIAIHKKLTQEGKCRVIIGDQERAEAYQQYFGVKATDYGNENFAKWTEAVKYLGRPFYELLAEEKFDAKSYEDVSLLHRERTASAPAIQLYDRFNKRNIVNGVVLFSAPNPSPEFTRQLVASLVSAWGTSKKSNALNNWSWNKSGYSASLTLESPVATGPYLDLRIVANIAE
jgi:hypothetical protein